jgi:transposase
VQTAVMKDLTPWAYLRDTLAKIAEGHPISRIDELMPWQVLFREGN